MPVIENLIQSQFAERRGVHGEVLLWVTARNRTTGLPESIGIWSGDDHRVFNVGGVDRTYLAVGGVIKVSPIRSITGLNTVYHSIQLPPFADQVAEGLTQYDPRLAPVELHAVAFDIDTGNLLAAPIRLIKGVLQEAPETLGEKGSRNSSTTLKVASSARRLSLGVPIYKSQETLEKAAPGDKGREYIAVAGEWNVPWGEE